MNDSSLTNKDTRDSALSYVWEHYCVFAATSRERKAKLYAWRFCVLALSIRGAIFGVLCQQSTGGELGDGSWKWLPKILGWLSAIALGFAAFFSREILKPDRERNWIRSRSLAEALKSQGYLFVTNAPPYDTTEAVDILFEKTKELLEMVKDLTTKPISNDEKRKGLPSNPLLVEQYIQVRVNDQIDNFYRPTTAKHEQNVKLWRNIGLCFGGLAVVLGALGSSGWTASWVAVISAITASIAAYLYAGRYQYLVISYQGTARRLEFLRARWEASGKTDADTDERNQFILDCEAAISVENSAWMAEFTQN